MVKKGKKGNVFDPLFLIVTFFVLVLFAVVVISQMRPFFNGLTNDTMFNSSNYSNAILNNTTAQAPSLWDGLLFTFLMGMFLYIIVSAYFIDTHPLYFGVGLLGLILTGFISLYLNNFFYGFVTTDPEFVTTLMGMPMCDAVIGNYLVWVIGVGLVVFMVLFIKGRRNNPGGL